MEKSVKQALCIGINNYPNSNMDLAGCVNDANDWGDALKAKGFSVKKLIDGAATKKGITEAMKGLIADAVKGDCVVFQYSGHGTYVPDLNGDEPDGTDECLVPHDVNTKGVITDDELFQIFDAKAKGVKLVFISDSCHSGSVSKFAPITTPPTITGGKAPRRLVRFMPPANFLKSTELKKLGSARAFRASFPPGRNAGLLMSGCQDTEYSYDAYFDSRPNGAFTYVALKTLKTMAANATYSQWHKKIREALPSQQYPQAPALLGTSTMKRWKIFQ